MRPSLKTDPSLHERTAAAAKAKEALRAKFLSRAAAPVAIDPAELAEKQRAAAAREEKQAAARAERLQQIEVDKLARREKAEAKRLAAEAKGALKPSLTPEQQKAARDARYAARKARNK